MTGSVEYYTELSVNSNMLHSVDLNFTFYMQLIQQLDLVHGEGRNLIKSLILKKPLQGSRLKVVEQAFKKADKTGDGVLTSDDLKK